MPPIEELDEDWVCAVRGTLGPYLTDGRVNVGGISVSEDRVGFA